MRAALGCAVLFSAASAGPFDYQTFFTGQSAWLISREQIFCYTYDTRSLRSIGLSDTLHTDSVSDAAVYDGVLYAAAWSGVYAVDMNTSTAEAIPAPAGQGRGARIAVDMDYIWYAAGDTLWQYDRLAQEWHACRRQARGPVLGVTAAGDDIYLLSDRHVEQFSTGNERWRTLARQGEPLESDAVVRAGAEGFDVVGRDRLLRFSVQSQSWQEAGAGGIIRDVAFGVDISYCLTDAAVIAVDMRTMVARPVRIAALHNPSAIVRSGDSLLVADERSLVKFVLPTETSETVEYAPQTVSTGCLYMAAPAGWLLVLHPGMLAVRSGISGVWEIAATDIAGSAERRVEWAERGLRVDYSGNTHSALHGSVKWKLNLDGNVVLIEDTLAPWKEAVPDETNLTLHTGFRGGRYIDVFFDDTRLNEVAAKGVHYGGAPDDVVRSAHAGTYVSSVAQSAAIPDVTVEGATVRFQSPRRVEGRDRRVVAGSAGAGMVISRTRREVLAYRPGREYPLGAQAAPAAPYDTIQIIPGTIRVSVDGEQLDTTQYTVFYATRTLQFKREDLIDPVSTIMVSYEVRTVPDSGLQAIELVPGNSFARYAHADVMVAPRSWISPRLAYACLWDEGRHDLISAALPLEWRREGSFMLKAVPEYTFDANRPDSARALSLGLTGNALGKFGLVFGGFVADSAFTTTDALSYGYGNRLRDIDYTLSYDVRDEIPIRYTQHNRRGTSGRDDRYEVSAGLRFPRVPFMDVSVSHSIDELSGALYAVDTLGAAITSDTVGELTLGKEKTRVQARLYETNSSWLTKLLRLERASYDISYTGFEATARRDTLVDSTGMYGVSSRNLVGRTVYGRTSLFPVSALAVTAEGMYRGNPHGVRAARVIRSSLLLQGMDLPRGVDAEGEYAIDLNRIGPADSSYLLLVRRGKAVLKPGMWLQGLRWFTLRGEVREDRACAFDTRDPDVDAILFGIRDVTGSMLKPSAGLDIVPSSRIVASTLGEWVVGDTSAIFTSTTTLQVLPGNRDCWSTRYRLRSSDDGDDIHAGYTRYEKTWSSWLRSTQGIGGSYTLGTQRLVELGPELELSLFPRNRRFLRSLAGTHTVDVKWLRTDGVINWNPSVNYAMDTRMTIKPDISFEMSHVLRFVKGWYDTYTATLKLMAAF